MELSPRQSSRYAKKGLAPWKSVLISVSALIVVLGGLWLANLLNWAGLRSPLPRFQPVEVVEEVVEQPADSVAVAPADTVALQ